MNPILQILQQQQAPQQQAHQQIQGSNSIVNESDPRGRVLSLISQLNPSQKDALKQQIPMIQKLARKFGISDANINQCLSELQGKI